MILTQVDPSVMFISRQLPDRVRAHAFTSLNYCMHTCLTNNAEIDLVENMIRCAWIWGLRSIVDSFQMGFRTNGVVAEVPPFAISLGSGRLLLPP